MHDQLGAYRGVSLRKLYESQSCVPIGYGHESRDAVLFCCHTDRIGVVEAGPDVGQRCDFYTPPCSSVLGRSSTAGIVGGYFNQALSRFPAIPRAARRRASAAHRS
ncbi:hypothetical protein PCASD_01570 [Puccinia coronata f. sp. avenae]|uniref:Uncharacterized protein n=1 Tax=Puccinia coronata f. sp. avenae TaxID=200324 RepID=A0A2N5VID9_9BASI|nr:hypothetical protein PCASD_06564 [Puccinia coronata f. sp. avenae]PLW49760.1 hypothetical protein PCASD_01570 [Puccinia coronata f. sp. avenae]